MAGVFGVLCRQLDPQQPDLRDPEAGSHQDGLLQTIPRLDQ